MIIEIKSCGWCPANFEDNARWMYCKLEAKHHKGRAKIPLWCPLREREVRDDRPS